MKVKEFIKKLNGFNPEARILVSCDEELNAIFSDIQAEYLDDGSKDKKSKVVIWGNSGSEE
jgi:hypothetical protein